MPALQTGRRFRRNRDRLPALAPLFTFLLFSPLFLYSQPKVDVSGGWIQEIGLHMEGTRVSKDLTILNRGTDTLKLTGIRTSCGCTVADLKEAVIAPGDSQNLHLVINTHNFIDGPVKKEVYFETNDNSRSQTEVVVNMVIRSIVQCIPRYISFSNIALGDSSVQTEYIKNNSDSIIIIEGINCQNSAVEARIMGNRPLAPGDSTAFTAVMHGNRTGNIIGEIEILTNYAAKPSVKLSYIGYVRK